MDQTDRTTLPVPPATRHALLSRRHTVLALATAVVGFLTLPISRLLGSREASLSPWSYTGALGRGLELQKQQKYDEAAREFTSVIRSQPDSRDAYLFRGIALTNGGRFEDAISDFSQALELREDGRAYIYRGQSYLAIGDKARAARDFLRALALPTDDERLVVTARIQLQIAEGER
ncbi:MAG: tetratricopeptide repeat protein [Chloroflexota bacterium]|nr:tetratricopeptide repeat protein [Chloroflexota bacterium]